MPKVVFLSTAIFLIRVIFLARAIFLTGQEYGFRHDLILDMLYQNLCCSVLCSK